MNGARLVVRDRRREYDCGLHVWLWLCVRYDDDGERHQPRCGEAVCPHDSETGDEGPVATLGRMPRRWRCDGCGRVREDARHSPSLAAWDEHLTATPGEPGQYRCECVGCVMGRALRGES